MKLSKLALSVSALALLVAPSLAFIHKKAGSASHKLEDAAEELHSETHHHFPSSYGSHGFEDRAADMHDAVHDLENGFVTECDVMSARGALKAQFADMTQQFAENGVLANAEVKAAFQKARMRYHLVMAFTAAGKCSGTSSAPAGGSFSSGGASL